MMSNEEYMLPHDEEVSRLTAEEVEEITATDIECPVEEEAASQTSAETEDSIEEDTADEADCPLDETNALEESTCDEEVEDVKLPEIPDTDALLAENSRLRTELETAQALHARMADELGEFHTLFPEVTTAAIPESIWEQVRRGVPLAASYALYEKKREIAMRHAEEINAQNSRLSAGQAGVNTSSEYFTVDEVNRMSHAEVRANYEKIRESMKKWNYNHN